MPERSSSSGVSTVPAQMMTSRRAVRSLIAEPCRTRTPVTRLPLKRRWLAFVLVATVMFRWPRAKAR
jgi:hypothetical protein